MKPKDNMIIQKPNENNTIIINKEIVKIILTYITPIITLILLCYNTIGQFYAFSFLTHFKINAYNLNLFNNTWFEGLNFLVILLLIALILLSVNISSNENKKKSIKIKKETFILFIILIIINNPINIPNNIFQLLLTCITNAILLFIFQITLKKFFPNLFKIIFLKNEETKEVMKFIWELIIIFSLITIYAFCIGRINASLKTEYFCTTNNEVLLYKGKDGIILAEGKHDNKNTLIIDKTKITYTSNLDIKGEYKQFSQVKIK